MFSYGFLLALDSLTGKVHLEGFTDYLVQLVSLQMRGESSSQSQ